MKPSSQIRRGVSTLLASLFLTLMLGAAALAQTTAFTYQGRFSDSSTNPPTTSGTYQMTFRLFDALTGGNQIPNNMTAISLPVSVANGIFTVNLDFGTTAFNTTQNRFLEVQVGSTVLTPRQQITAAPFSLMAKMAANSSTVTSGATVSVASRTLVALNYQSAAAITDLTDGVEGQCVVLLANNNNVSIADSGNFKLSANWSPLGTDSLTVCRSSAFGTPFWYETARSANNFLGTLTVIKAGAGSGTVTSNPAGINCGADCSESYESDTVVTLTATPASGSTFSGWSGGGCSGTGTCTTTMDASKTVTATFTSNSFTLTVTRAGAGNGTVTSSPAGINCGADCSETYASGTTVMLTATPSANSSFAGWSGGGCSGTGSCVVNVTSATSVTATFILNNFTLTVTKAGAGSGTVTSNPAGINCGADCSEAYGADTMVTLTATPASGSSFAGWSGGGCSGTGTCTVTMSMARSVTATFATP